MTAHVAMSRGRDWDKKCKSIATHTKAPRFFAWDKANFTWIGLSLSLKTVQESLFKISLEHHSVVPEHFLKIDCESAKMQLTRVALLFVLFM